MCLDLSPSVDRSAQFAQQNAAEEARIREAIRQRQIEAGFNSLDALFGGGAYDPSGALRDIAGIVQGAQSFGSYKGKRRPQQVELTPGVEGDTLDDIDFGSVNNVLDLFQLPTSIREEDRGLFGRDQLPGAIQGAEGIEPSLDAFAANTRAALMPQFERQQEQINEENTFALARAGLGTGVGSSTIAADRQADINTDATLGIQAIENEVANARSGLADDFADLRSDLETMLLTTGDAQRVGQRATDRIQQLYRKAPTTSPLGDVFANAAASINAFNQGAQLGQIRNISYDPSAPEDSIMSPFGLGSGRVVG